MMIPDCFIYKESKKYKVDPTGAGSQRTQNADDMQVTKSVKNLSRHF